MSRAVDTVSVSIVASGVIAVLMLVSTVGAGAGEQPPPKRVLVSPSSRAPAVTPSASAESVRSAGSTSVAATQPVVPESEMLPLLDRVRALEAEIVELHAQLAAQRREDAAALSALRSQLATQRQDYDAHYHRLVSGCVSPKNIYPDSDLEGCVYVQLGPGTAAPSTSAPAKYPH